MNPVRLHREAEEDLVDARNWYRARSEVAAQAFVIEIEHALRSIAEAPMRWPRGMRGERRFVLDRFPYTLHYRVKADHVFITAIAHQSRRRGYWRHRK